jgi:hypothetical protein
MICQSIHRRYTAFGVAAVMVVASVPLRAQDRDSVFAALFQSQRHEGYFEQRAAPQPSRGWYSPFQLDHRFPRREKRRNKINAAKPVPVEKSQDSVKPAQIPSNPQLALMTDPTLRHGDIVMFPDGPRVFQGSSGERHAASDFVPFGKASGLAAKARKYLTALRSGVNDSWADISDSTKLAQNTRDVETTGSVSKKRSRR